MFDRSLRVEYDKKDRSFSFRFSDRERQLLDAECGRTGETLSQLLERTIWESLARDELEVLIELGFTSRVAVMRWRAMSDTEKQAHVRAVLSKRKWGTDVRAIRAMAKQIDSYFLYGLFGRGPKAAARRRHEQDRKGIGG